jgi:hypothetical protein
METKGMNNLKQIIYILITKKNFKKLCMKMQTKEGENIRDYFMEIENLLLIYLKYQCECEKISYNKIIEEIKEMKHIKEYSKIKNEERIKYKEELEKKEGYVYYINEEEDLNYFKIGYTYDVKERLEDLQTGNRRKLKIYYKKLIKKPENEETRLHKKFKKYKILNEWYKININMIE